MSSNTWLGLLNPSNSKPDNKVDDVPDQHLKFDNMPCDRVMSDREFSKRGKDWSRATFAISGGRLLKIKASPNSHNSREVDENSKSVDEVASLDDDELEVE